MSPRPAHLRRPLAALFTAAAAVSALAALRPGPAPSTRVLTAARDLPGGAALTPSDLRLLPLPPSAVPSGALRRGATGRVLAGPMRRGEPLTDARLLGDDLLDGYGPATVAAPVRLSDAATTRLLHPGDRIDLLTTAQSPTSPSSTPPPTEPETPPPQPSTARLIVSRVPVLTIPPRDDTSQDGALIVIAATRPQAAALAAAGPSLTMTITG